MYLANYHLWYLLIVFPLFLFGLLIFLKKKELHYYQELGNKVTLSTLVNRSRFLARFRLALFFSALFFITFSLLRPQWGLKKENVVSKGLDVVIALDLSTSMLAEDIVPSRIDKASMEISRLLEKLQGNRVALITFSGSATPVCPLTTDLGAIKMFLRSRKYYKEPIPGTNIENAFESSLRLFDFEAPQDKIWLLITDGESHEGDISKIVGKAKNKGIIIIPVAVGTPGGQPIPLLNDKGERIGYKKDKKGEVVISRLDIASLKELATIGPYQLNSEASSIVSLASDLRHFKTTKLKELRISIYSERYQLFLFIGLILLFTYYALSEFEDKIYKKG